MLVTHFEQGVLIMGRIQVYSPKEEREKADIAVRVGNKLVKKLALGSRASFEVQLTEKADYWTSRAVDAVQSRNVIEQDFAINVAKGYKMKIDRILDSLVEEEPCQIDVWA